MTSIWRDKLCCPVADGRLTVSRAPLDDRIAFGDIYRTIEATLANTQFIAQPVFDDYVATNSEARARAASFIDNISK